MLPGEIFLLFNCRDLFPVKSRNFGPFQSFKCRKQDSTSAIVFQVMDRRLFNISILQLKRNTFN